MEKKLYFYWTGLRGACILNALYALGVSTLLGDETDKAENRHEGKTKIRTTSVVKESRVLDKLSRVENELEEIRRERLALQDERKALEREKARLRQEFIETMERYKSLDSMYRRLQLEVAAMVDASGKTEVGTREVELLDALRQMTGKSQALTLRIADFCDFMDSALGKIDIDKLEKARIQYRLDRLKAEIINASTVTEQYSR